MTDVHEMLQHALSRSMDHAKNPNVPFKVRVLQIAITHPVGSTEHQVEEEQAT